MILSNRSTIWHFTRFGMRFNNISLTINAWSMIIVESIDTSWLLLFRLVNANHSQLIRQILNIKWFRPCRTSWNENKSFFLCFLEFFSEWNSTACYAYDTRQKGFTFEWEHCIIYELWTNDETESQQYVMLVNT